MATSIYDISFRLSPPVSISFHTFTHSYHVIIRHEERGIEGLGEACPFKPITKDTKQDNISAFRSLREVDVEKLDLDGIGDFIPSSMSSTSRAAIDMMLHDMIGKREGKPVYRLYSKNPALVPNTVTIYIGGIGTAAASASAILKSHPGVKAIKVKLEGRAEDFDRVKSVVDSCPKGTKFIIDANRGFTDTELAIRTLNAISDYTRNVIAVEEPFRFDSPRQLREIRENVSIPVFGDESIATIEEAARLAESDAIDGINIKIQKMGGIRESRKIAEFAEDNGLKLMVGCMLESPVSISAGLAFAVSTKGVIATDLDSDLGLPAYFGERAAFSDGFRIPAESAGLGAAPDMRKLKSADGQEVSFRQVE